MKVHEMINALKRIEKKHGNVEVVMCRPGSFNVGGLYIDGTQDKVTLNSRYGYIEAVRAEFE